jgi:hypothetical protein
VRERVAKKRIKVVSGESEATTRFRYKQLIDLHRLKWHESLTLLALLLLTLVFLFLHLQSRKPPEVETLPEHLIHIEEIRCSKFRFPIFRYRTQMGFADYYDLKISSYGFYFVAVETNGAKCQYLAKTLSPETDIWIRHYNGLIFQLRLDDKILLRTSELQDGIKHQIEFEGRGYKAMFYLLLMILSGYGLFLFIIPRK